MYKIKDYSFKKAKEEGVVIKPSKKKNKKIDVYKNNKYIASIGDDRYKDYPTYILEKGKDYADSRRKLYYKRHDKDTNDAGYYAKKLLW